MEARKIPFQSLYNQVGSGTILKFKNDPITYYGKNLSPDLKSIFVTSASGTGTWNKKLKNITYINNNPVIITESIMEEFDKKELKQGEKVEQEHKATYEKIKAYYNKHKEMPSKDKVYEWIAEDHLEEFEKYYGELDKMEDYLAAGKEIKPLKEHTIVNDRRIDAIKDNFKPPVMMEAEPIIPNTDTIDIDQTTEPEPELTDLEQKTDIIDTRQNIEGIIADIETILLDPEAIAQLPVKLNIANKLDSVLTSLKTLRGELDGYSKIVQESTGDSRKTLKEESSSTEEDNDKIKGNKKPEKKKRDDGRELLFGKRDVENLLLGSYKITESENENKWVIVARNPFRESKNSLINYKLNVYFDNNFLNVKSLNENRAARLLAEQVENDLREDLERISEVDDIITNPQEISNTDAEENDFLAKALRSIFENSQEVDFTKGKNEYFTKDLEAQIEEYMFEMKSDGGTSKTVYPNITYDENYNFPQEPKYEILSITIEEEYEVNLAYERGSYFTPDYSGAENSVPISSSWTEVYLNGGTIIVSEENKILLNKYYNK